MSALARILDACDTVVSAIGALWNPSAPDEVKRVFAPAIGLTPDNADSLISGRKVYVFPGQWGTPGAATRTEIYKEHTITVLIVERWVDEDGNTPQGEVPNDWLDARILFTESLFDLLANPTTIHTGTLVSLWRDPETPAQVDVLYDMDLLLEDKKAFWSRFTITFRELVGAAGS